MARQLIAIGTQMMDRSQPTPVDQLNRRGAILIGIARDHLASTLAGAPPADPESLRRREPWLLEPGAVFVTLRRDGKLRGCVGSLEATQPVLEDVCANVLAAATRDHRFSTIEAAELSEISIEISLLTPPEPMHCTSEADALTQLRPGVDGVLLQRGARRATFLPQVWETLPTPELFLNQLKKKAGLAADAWDDTIHLERYRVVKWCESDT